MRFSPATFAIAFIVTYVAAFWLGQPMFLYYPQSGLLHWGSAAVSNVGPGISWYGLLADAALVAVVAALLVPNRIPDKLLHNYLWAVPAAAMLVCLYLLRNFFLS